MLICLQNAQGLYYILQLIGVVLCYVCYWLITKKWKLKLDPGNIPVVRFILTTHKFNIVLYKGC